MAVADGEALQLRRGDFGLGNEVQRCLQHLPHAWRLTGLLCLAFVEDFAIVDGASATIPWIAACLPSHWAPERKVGRHFTEVHAPVADNALLVQAGEHLMRMVCSEQRWERFVWNVTRHPRLNAHPLLSDPAPWADDAFADSAAPRAWWRTEHQTFIPLTAQRQAIFTIAVNTRPLAEAIDTPAKAARLHDAVASMSESVRRYRSLDAVHAPLLRWLHARAAASA